ncbi:MAG: SDR family NAD(P)-dependent oxidoreductase [Bacillota bacterium]
MRLLLDAVGLVPGELAGRVAVVTGAARGIGRAAAAALAALGAQVAVVDTAEEGEQAAGQIRAAGGAARFFRVDVADEAAVADLCRTVRAEMGPASIVVNNAMVCPVAPVEQLTLELWERVMAVNLRGAFLITRGLLPQLREADAGTLVNLVSTDAMPGLSAYIASKQGLVGFTQSVAAEVGEGSLRVVAFAPGMVETPGLLEAGRALAPLLGMTEAEFRRISLHPAYGGPMPVEHAGLALAFLVARLAGEYHGQVVSGYEILERAGLIAQDGRVQRRGSHEQAPAEQPAAVCAPAAGPADALSGGLARLRDILAETAADFQRLPVFVRPLARSGFRAQTGKSVQAWQQEADALLAGVRAGRTLDRARLHADLERLIAYVESVPAETARFTRDAAVLAQVQARMNAYARDLRALQAALREDGRETASR